MTRSPGCFLKLKVFLPSMAFNTIPHVPNPSHVMDFPFKRAAKVSRIRSKSSPEIKAKQLALARAQAFTDAVTEMFLDLEKGFPSINSMSEFYQELTRSALDEDMYCKDIATLAWAVKKIREQRRTLSDKLKTINDTTATQKALNNFYGRSASLLKRVSPMLERLRKAREAFLTFPSIKEGLYTVCIAGFPNVGKSTLLSKITSAKPEIKNYAFTTKSLNTGYFNIDYHKIQVIDVPGTLDREDKMNAIEKQAYLAMKYLADVIVWIYDPTQTYPEETQWKLRERLLEIDKPLITYVSKTDVEHHVSERVKKLKPISTPEELIERIRKEKQE
jgi:nucleolar GTP-binding protein